MQKYDAYDLEFQYNSNLTQKDITNQEIYLFGDIDLKNNSSVAFNQAFYRGNIKGDSTSSASFSNAVAKGSVSVNKLSASGSHFLLEVSNDSNKLIEATQKAEGGGGKKLSLCFSKRANHKENPSNQSKRLAKCWKQDVYAKIL